MAEDYIEMLEELTRRMDNRAERIANLRRYARGEQALPEASEHAKEAWKQFQRIARTNWGGLIVDALAERIVPKPVTIEGDKTAEAVARRIWRENRMELVWAQARRDWLTTSYGYLLVTRRDDGHAVITAERPEQMITLPNPLQPWRADAALKVTRNTRARIDTALLWTAGRQHRFTRPSIETSSEALVPRVSGGWQYEGIDAEYLGQPPVHALFTPSGMGEFEEHTALIDRITRSTLERLTTAAIQAFKQRGLVSTDGQPLPTEDEDGKPVDYSGIFAAGAGIMWELPPGTTVWESSQTDIGPLVAATKEDIKQLCAVTRTPVPILIPDAQNQSAEGALAAREGLIAKADVRIAIAKPTLEGVMKRALEVEGVETGETIEVAFRSAAVVSLSSMYAAAAQARAAGESIESVQRNVLGYTPDQILADRMARAMESLNFAVASREASSDTAEA